MKTIASLFIAGCIPFFLASNARSQLYTFSTIAGQAGQRSTTDGTNSIARFYWPRCVTLDPFGNLFVTDDTTIRRMSRLGTNWIVNTLAGFPRLSGGTDGTNENARFDTPSGIAVDAATNLYVADWGNHTIRKIVPLGTNWVVTTLAGVLGHAGSADGAGTNALFNHPFGLTRDNAGNLFVVDSENDSIRKLSPEGTDWIVTTIAGSATNSGSADGTNTLARFRQPRDIAVDGLGILYITDRLNGTVRKLTPVGTNWVVTTIAGLAGQKSSTDGTNQTARFSGPDGIGLDNAGDLYVTDNTLDNIRKLTAHGTNWIVTTIGGSAGTNGSLNGIGTNALFNFPDNIKVDNSGQLYITDRDNYTIRSGIVTVGPKLHIYLAGSQAILSWPTNDASFYLESAAQLELFPTAWAPVTNTPSVMGGNFEVTVERSTSEQFFRLHD